MLNQPDLFAEPGPDPCTALKQDLVLLDLETTGTNPNRDRIIEIGLIHCRGLQIVDSWSTLVNPPTDLSPFIADYTGISDSMLASAPIFAEIADVLLKWLDRGLLVAHNARFDCSFLHSEFSRLGFDFQAPYLCTVKLSRKLFPAESRHNLDALIIRHKLQCDNRHRALGDARVLVDFLRALPNHCAAELIEQTFNDLVSGNKPAARRSDSDRP